MEGFSVLLGSVLLIALIAVPGMALTLALFPRWKQISFIERLGIAVVFGTMPQLLLYLLNKNSGVEITFGTSFLSVLLVTGLGLLAYHLRRQRQK